MVEITDNSCVLTARRAFLSLIFCTFHFCVIMTENISLNRVIEGFICCTEVVEKKWLIVSEGRAFA